LSAVVVILGGLAFAIRVMRGSTDEIARLVTGIRIAGGVLIVGSLVEYLGVARRFDEAWLSAWSTSAGAATLMRTVGGVAVFIGLRAATVVGRPGRTLSSAAFTPAASTSVASTSEVDANSHHVDPHEAGRWTPGRTAWLAFAGAALIVISFWFDGHTVTKGFRPLHALSNSVHVLAGSIWAGGAISMALVLWGRHHADRSTDGAGVVVRFSSVATVALAAVVVAGVVMAVSILDTFGELTSTQWGKTMLVKLAAVGVAIVLGAYNHFRLRPALERSPEDPDLLRSARVTLTMEAITLGLVAGITSWLVAAAF
jgi:copper transport protein